MTDPIIPVPPVTQQIDLGQILKMMLTRISELEANMTVIHAQLLALEMALDKKKVIVPEDIETEMKNLQVEMKQRAEEIKETKSKIVGLDGQPLTKPNAS